ncbi:hypothetical protein VL03_10700 [Rossellomorea marisflavi]|nr:hypothetical protein VL03_10700 [Rossellomorea marisflavi]
MTISTIVFTAAVSWGLIALIHWSLFDIDRLEPGELITEETSPDGRYTVQTFRNNGGATVDYAVLGVLTFNEKDRGVKNIYWQYHEEEGKVSWVDDDTVQINDQVLHVPDEVYDYRRE